MLLAGVHRSSNTFWIVTTCVVWTFMAILPLTSLKYESPEKEPKKYASFGSYTLQLGPLKNKLKKEAMQQYYQQKSKWKQFLRIAPLQHNCHLGGFPYSPFYMYTELFGRCIKSTWWKLIVICNFRKKSNFSKLEN